MFRTSPLVQAEQLINAINAFVIPAVAQASRTFEAFPKSAPWAPGHTVAWKLFDAPIFTSLGITANVIPTAPRQFDHIASHTNGHGFSLDQMPNGGTLLIKAQNFFVSSVSIACARKLLLNHCSLHYPECHQYTRRAGSGTAHSAGVVQW